MAIANTSKTSKTSKSSRADIFFETFGPEGAPAILLLAPYATQMLIWSSSFCDALAAAGYFVIRFDHRDSGLSEKFGAAGLPDLMQVVSVPVADRAALVPYTLEDMAEDAFGVLDAVGIEAAHLVGASLGGMVAQVMATRHPARALSLTSIMSTPDVAKSPPIPEEHAPPRPVPDGLTEDPRVLGLMRGFRALGTRDFGPDDDELLAFCAACVARAHYPEGPARQIAAIHASPGRDEALAKLSIPTLVIHGTEDQFIPIIGGELTAEAIPGAQFIGVEGLGHELFSPTLALVKDLLLEHLHRWEGAHAD